MKKAGYLGSFPRTLIGNLKHPTDPRLRTHFARWLSNDPLRFFSIPFKRRLKISALHFLHEFRRKLFLRSYVIS